MDFTVTLSGSRVFCLSYPSKESTMCCLLNVFTSGIQKDKKPDRREQAKWVAACRSAIVCHKLFILSSDIDIILQETLPRQLSQKVKHSPPAGHMRGWSKLCYFAAQLVNSGNSSLWESV